MSGVRAYAALSLLVAGMLLVGACDGDKSSDSTPPGSTAPTVVVPASGVDEVDHIERAAVAADTITLAELTGYTTIVCVTRAVPQLNIGDPPTCESSETPGTAIEVVAFTQCGGGWARPVAAPDAYRLALAGAKRSVDSAYKAAATGPPLGATLHEDYVVVVRVEDESGGWKRVAFHLSGGRVVWVESACPAQTDLATQERVAEFLIAPTDPVPTDITVEPIATP